MKKIALAIILVSLFVSKSSFALGKLGHKVVCQLTFEHLSSANQAKITALLKNIPVEHQALINKYNYEKKDQPISFANACTWADTIKRMDDFRSYNSWHYMNVPRDHNIIQANDCTQNCLPQAILHHQKILTVNKNNNNWQQTQALLYLAHWLGDIHQPLHVSFSDDLGGNKVKFAPTDTKCKNLHWYWDDCILFKGKHSETKWLTLLRDNWSQHSQPQWQNKQVWQWADESFQIVKDHNFNYCQLTQQGSCNNIESDVKLPPDYFAQYQPVMEQRLLQAAQRLTKVLEETL